MLHLAQLQTMEIFNRHPYESLGAEEAPVCISTSLVYSTASMTRCKLFLTTWLGAVLT